MADKKAQPILRAQELCESRGGIAGNKEVDIPRQDTQWDESDHPLPYGTTRDVTAVQFTAEHLHSMFDFIADIALRALSCRHSSPL